MLKADFSKERSRAVINFSMLYLTIPLVAGIVAGFLLRGKKRVDLSRANVAIILVLIFSLGFSIGVNNELLNSLPRIGVSALTMASLAIAFSVFFTTLVGRKLKA
jgi:drug/metabolite transporter (DMT)-like permease